MTVVRLCNLVVRGALRVLSWVLMVELTWSMKNEVIEWTADRLTFVLCVCLRLVSYVLTIVVQCLREKTRAMPISTFVLTILATVGSFLGAVGTPTRIPGWLMARYNLRVRATAVVALCVRCGLILTSMWLLRLLARCYSGTNRL